MHRSGIALRGSAVQLVADGISERPSFGRKEIIRESESGLFETFVYIKEVTET